MLDKSKLYYLSHPFTTHGNLEDNQDSAYYIEIQLVQRHEISMINPILLPLSANSDIKEMEKCRYLYQACDAVIFCPDWDKSAGCTEEHKWAIQDSKPRYFVDKDGNLLLDRREAINCG
jgi:hypothetical protein